ncbi:MAG: mechanosensitive ion channel family protein [Anaerolineae bacterium]|uniref:mechanosensitive ion channel family protein n=1 Tax=Candidatus Flexifilum breve TaxID=3140694 RepID=UPI001AC801EE|nr:mechanosensitive ion channel family protein [Chloroflexota bacterium]MBN8639969.1 mechanosensitive ion channel family protein [Anaerolineae bacterium]
MEFSQELALFGARVVLVLILLIAIWLLRRLIAWLLARPLERIVTRAGRTDLIEPTRGLFSTATGYLLLALWIDLGARIFDFHPTIMNIVQHLTRTLVIVAFAVMIYRLVASAVYSRNRLLLFTGITIEEALIPFVRTGLQLLILAIGLVIIIQEWGYDVSGLIAGLGLGGLALSLAAQDTLANIFGFTAVVGDRPFVVGEFIKTKDVEGTIEHVGLRSTRVRQINQAVVTVPNSMLASAAVLNWSRLTKRQVDMTLNISYDADAETMQSMLGQIRAYLSDHEKVEPGSVVVYLVNFGSSSMEVLVRCYLTIGDWKEFTATKEGILLEILRIVNQLGLHIAFPRSALYIDNLRGELNLSEQPLAPPK